jgi:ATP/maltotriose-dependent transcriptional regulator MalT
LAFFLCNSGDAVAGRVMFAQALDAFKLLGIEIGTAQVLGTLAESEFKVGNAEEALRLVGESLEIYLRGKNAKHLAMNYNNCAAYQVALGDVDGARISARDGLRWARQAQTGLQAAVAVQHIALVALLRGQAQVAATLNGFVEIQYKELLYEREPTERWGHDKLMSTLRTQLSIAEIDTFAAEGAGWSEDRAIEEALKV